MPLPVYPVVQVHRLIKFRGRSTDPGHACFARPDAPGHPSFGPSVRPCRALPMTWPLSSQGLFWHQRSSGTRKGPTEPPTLAADHACRSPQCFASSQRKLQVPYVQDTAWTRTWTVWTHLFRSSDAPSRTRDRHEGKTFGIRRTSASRRSWSRRGMVRDHGWLSGPTGGRGRALELH